jgi:hypothetical protein
VTTICPNGAEVWNIMERLPGTLEIACSRAGLLARSLGIFLQSPSEIMERILAAAGARVRDGLAATGRLAPLEVVVVKRARCSDPAACATLSGPPFSRGSAKVKEAVVPETDAQAVRIMTIHASKGLEFPMVVLAGAGSTRGGSLDKALWDEFGQLQVHISGNIESAGYPEAKEAEAELLAAEKRRLLYVACTRATSHLVVSLYSGGPSSLSGMLGSVDDPETVQELEFPEAFPAREKSQHGVSPLPAFDEWQDMRARWVAQSAIPASTSVTALTKGGSVPAAEAAGARDEPLQELSFADDAGAGAPFSSAPSVCTG